MFNGNGYAPSVADIAAVTNGNNCCNGYGYGYGFGADWWIIVLIMAMFGWGGFGGNRGWGGGFNGFNGCNSCCTPATCAEVQNGFNQQATINKLNGIENGICSLGYDQLNQMNGINQNIFQTGTGLQQSLNQMAIAQMQDTNSVSRQLSDCCCESREAIQGVNYNMAQQFCNLGNQVNQIGQQVIQNSNNNYRALHDELVSYRMQDKDETIAELRNQVQALNLAQSQANQNTALFNRMDANQAELIRRLGRDCPTPAYIVPNPFCCNEQNTCCRQCC